MMTAKVFENGRSQAVRLPKECRFQSDEVAIKKIGDIVLLIPKENQWSGFLESLDVFSDDFMCEERVQLESECRSSRTPAQARRRSHVSYPWVSNIYKRDIVSNL